MQESLNNIWQQEWVIWNGANGLLTTVTLGQIETGAAGRMAWLDEPFDMVGPFDLDSLEQQGFIHFAACTVMSRQRWQEDQMLLRRESHKRRRQEEARIRERLERMSRNRSNAHHSIPGDDQQHDDQQYRTTLNLPVDGKLKVRQINAAFRKLAQKAHPDAGGDAEQFIRLATAREALIACSSA